MSAIHASLSSLEANRKKLELTSLNIANVDTEGYSRRGVTQESVVSAGNIQGVSITEITTKTDTLLEQNLLQKTSEASFSSTKQRYFEAMNEVFGTPGDSNSLDTFITNAFKELNTLSENLNLSTQKVVAVDSLSKVAEQISYIATNLNDLRYQADRELGTITEGLNAELKNAYYLSLQTYALPEGTLEHVESAEKLQNSIVNLAEYFPLNQYNDPLGRLHISTSRGISLLGTEFAYQAKYTPLTSGEDFTNQFPLEGYYITGVTDNGNDLNLNIQVAPGGISGQTAYSVGPGKVSALLEMRDIEIPKALNQLDLLAKKLKDEFNNVHNIGNGYPPATSLTATNLTSRDQTLEFSGSVRVAVVDDNGLPYSNIPALTLDLSKLNSGNGIGKSNLEGIINEINYHYNQRLTLQNSINLGSLSDIKLAAVSSTINPSSSFTLDLDLTNFSAISSQISITSVTATDNMGVNILSSFNNAAHNIASGSMERTGTSGPSITLMNTVAPLEYPYTITVNCQVVEDTTTYTGTITYQINNPSSDPLNGVINQRFGATSTSGQATIVQPTVNGGVVTATLLDDNGGVIASNNTANGRLSLSTTNSSYHLVIDQLDSKYLGDSAHNVLPTNEGFSTFFGLNDLFVRTDAPTNWSNTLNSAVYLSVRSDIKADANLLSTGALRQTHSNFANSPIYTYEVTSGDNTTLTDLIQLGSKPFFFQTASGLPATTTTFASYATEILSFNSIATSLMIKEAARNELFREALQDKLDSIRGVDLNAELTNLILYQQNFAASSKVIQTAREFNDTLLSTF